MQITITDAKRMPSWQYIQDFLRHMLDNEKGMIQKINRTDKGIDYGTYGEYDVVFDQQKIKLTITAEKSPASELERVFDVDHQYYNRIFYDYKEGKYYDQSTDLYLDNEETAAFLYNRR